MRDEFKFRAYNVDTKEMIYGDCLEIFGLLFEKLQPVVISQFTGKKDKAGKDIYEGDILKMTYKKGEYYTRVVWDNNGFVLSPNKSILIDSMSLTIARTTGEVMGNIYQNGKLLNTIL